MSTEKTSSALDRLIGPFKKYIEIILIIGIACGWYIDSRIQQNNREMRQHNISVQLEQLEDDLNDAIDLFLDTYDIEKLEDQVDNIRLRMAELHGNE